jgi:hypothetical protein
MTITYVKATMLLALLALAIACGKNSEPTSAPWFVSGRWSRIHRWRALTGNKQIELSAETALPFKLTDSITLK